MPSGEGIHAWRFGDGPGPNSRSPWRTPPLRFFEIGGRAVVNRNTFERDYGRLGVSAQGLAFGDLFGGVFVANDGGIDGPVDLKFLGDLDRHVGRSPRQSALMLEDHGWLGALRGLADRRMAVVHRAASCRHGTAGVAWSCAGTPSFR